MVGCKGEEEVVVAKEGNSYSEKIEDFPKLLRLLLQGAVKIDKIDKI